MADGLLLWPALGACLLLTILICVVSFGVRASGWIFVVLSCAVAPALLIGGSAVYHVGIAGPAPEVRTFAVVIGAGVVLGLLTLQRGSVPLPLVGLGTGILLAAEFAWPGTPVVAAGVVQLLIGIGAWYVGSMVGVLSRRSCRLISMLLLGVVLLQIVFAGIQLLGMRPALLTPIDAAILGDRVNGTTNHPDTLGKMLLVVILLCLFVFERGDKFARRMAGWAIVLAFVPLVLAQGRANMVAAVVAIGAWALLLPTAVHRSARRNVMFGLGLAVVLAVGALWSRFQEDPGGGVRSTIAPYAVEQIGLTPWFGVGPNNYTSVVGPRTGSWIPVHNSFLLLVAELGIPLAAMFALAIAVLVVRGWRRRKLVGADGAASRVLLAAIPGVLLIGLTGWGLLGTSIFPLAMFALGVATVNIGSGRVRSDPHTTTVDTSSIRRVASTNSSAGRAIR